MTRNKTSNVSLTFLLKIQQSWYIVTNTFYTFTIYCCNRYIIVIFMTG